MKKFYEKIKFFEIFVDYNNLLYIIIDTQHIITRIIIIISGIMFMKLLISEINMFIEDYFIKYYY